MSVKDSMERKLSDGLSPIRLAVIDDSHRHVGHAGSRAGGESHFSVEIVSVAFNGKGRVERQRMVYALLADEMAAGLHALGLTTLTPDEDVKRAPEGN